MELQPQENLTYYVLIFLLLQTFTGFFVYFFLKYCCCCGKKVGSSSTIYKYTPFLMFSIEASILLLYIFLCYLGELSFDIYITWYLSIYVFALPLFMHLGGKFCKKIPTIFLGRRVCCRRIPKINLKEILLHVDRFIPIRQEIANLQNICMRKGGEVIRYALERKFHEAHPVEVLFAGSTFENFGLPISSAWIKDFDTIPRGYPLLTDFDLMLFFDNVLASEDKSDGSAHFHIQNSTEQGFVTLHVTEYGLRHLSSRIDALFVSTGSNHDLSRVISAKNVSKMLYSVIANTKLDSYQGGFEDIGDARGGLAKINIAKLNTSGPAVQLKVGTTKTQYWACCFLYENDGFLADFVFGIKTNWPSISDWKDRTDRFWPSPEDVMRIVQDGCHFVAKAQPEDSIGITWRYSFSKAEVELSKLVNPVVKKCYLALKMISKDHLQPIAPWLKSYHLKTILYHTLEKTPTDVWKMEEIETCFKLLFENFKTSLNNGICQHYWISNINLFDMNLVKKRYHYKTFSSVLDKISVNPVKFINIYEPKVSISLNYENQVARNNDQEHVEVMCGPENYPSFELIGVDDRVELL